MLLWRGRIRIQIKPKNPEEDIPEPFMDDLESEAEGAIDDAVSEIKTSAARILKENNLDATVTVEREE